MGSVELFPRKPAAATLADVWHAGPLLGDGLLRLRPARMQDYTAVRALLRTSGASLPPCTLKQFEDRRLAFVQGQLLAHCDGALVGYSSALIVPWGDVAANRSWGEVTGNGHFTTHDPAGKNLYVAALATTASERGNNVARVLVQAQRRLARARNLQRIIVTCPLAHYADHRERMTPEQYAMRVIWGDIAEPSMGFALTQGFQYCGILHGFCGPEGASCRHAALLAWLNPSYAPSGPGAFTRSRLCA